ncbi:MAG: NAD(P)/FAD-dependent oxidoreductase [Ardenticatenaceae bacterium]|nr:NAD(P)/FAD-dependent oxidoreductase [Anaerolineales bacterium]MCB8920282.1 NAD(P)/FAD-dependent oxidoreductase [Ardenticatenaceae bacterium]
MSNKKVIIIGAGIAGLSAGSYLQMNGYETEIFEMHTIPGGLCTTWKKKGYAFDGCIHSIAGLNPNFKMYHYWNELLDLSQMRFHFYDELVCYTDERGNVVHFYTDPDKLEAELLRIAPEDAGFIRRFIKSVKHLARHDMQLSKPIELWTPLDYFLSQFRTAPYLKHLIQWSKSWAETTKNCQSPLLKRVYAQDFFSRFPAYFLLLSIAHMHQKNAGYPIGGSLPLALALAEKYKALGGKIHYDAKVERILVENDRAVGIQLADGTSHHADRVISAADGHHTIFKLLGGKYVNKKVKKLYSEHPFWPSMVLVSLGVARTFENESPELDIDVIEPFVVDGRSHLTSLPVTIYNFDPTLAGAGKTSLRVILKTGNYQYWHNLRQHDPDAYQQEKQRVADALIEILERRLGNIKNYLEVVDVSTPATFIRYTNNWQGSTQGWEWLPGGIPETIDKTVPGLDNFHMIGQWVQPGGGVPTSFMSGRDVTRIICKQDGRKFQTI